MSAGLASRRPTSGAGRGSRHAVWALGALTIAAYGSWYYGFGVLIDPIRRAENWSVAALATVFGATIMVNGVGAALGGRLLDRGGPRSTFALGAILGGGGLALASLQHTLFGFGVFYAIGGGSIGALGFYHVTQAAAARAASDTDRSRAITRLTLLGAFASPIFLPLTAWLVKATTWRTAVLVDAAAIGVAFSLAAMLVPDHRTVERPNRSGRAAFSAAWNGHAFRRLLIATLLSGVAADIMLAFQVPIMRAAGLSLATAAAVAGARGFAQLLGRIPLGHVLRTVPARLALAVAQVGGAVAALLLLGSGILAFAIAFSLLAGASTGASSPLQGIYTAQLVESGDLGLLLGVQQALYGIAGACGPILVGVLLSVTGSWIPAIAMTAGGFAGAAALLLSGDARPRRSRLSREPQPACC